MNGSYFLIALVLAAGCRQAENKEAFPREAHIPVKLMQLEQTTVAGGDIPASGLFSTEEEAALSFKNGGVIERLLVKEGDAVKKGQLLATVNATEINIAVQQARLGLEKAKRDYERASQLYADSVATLEQMQNAKTAMDVAARQFEAVSFNEGYAEIRATTSGYVLKRLVNIGQVVGPGTPVFLINGARNSDWLLNVGVTDRQWAQIRIGDSAAVETDAVPGKKLVAYVYKKSEGVDPRSGTLQVQLKLKSNTSPSVASGVFGKARIFSSAKGSGWVIPADALLDGDAGKGYVFVTRDGQTAHKQEITVGGLLPDSVVVTGGLEGAPSVIISGSPYLREGSLIEVK